MDYLRIALTPALLLAAGLLSVHFRGLHWRKDVGFKAPRLAGLVLWCALFLLFQLAAELVVQADQTGMWRGRYSGADLAIRLVAVPLVYALVEEFFFRGVLLGVVHRRFGVLAGVLVPALMFAAIHVHSDWRGMVLLLADGLFYGVARVRTGSVYVAMLLHAAGNGYAVWDRLSPPVH